MKRLFRLLAAGFIFILLIPLSWLVWRSQPAQSDSVFEAVAEAVVSPVAAETMLPLTYTPRVFQTPGSVIAGEPSVNIPPPATLTAVPTSTKTPTPTPPKPTSPTISPSQTSGLVYIPDGVDRTCPDPAPLKPEYNRYFVPSQSWPQPIVGGEEHFWLSNPLSGGGRLLYTDWFPYGFDGGGRYLLHNGLDIPESLGTPLLAMASGTVIVAGDDYSRLFGWRCNWYGHLVVVELDDRWLGQPVYLLYGHVLEINVAVGERVNRGEQLAEVGVGGAATVPHLHFEVRIGTNEFKSTRSPLLWIQQPVTRGIIAGRLLDPEGRPWQGVAINAFGLSEGMDNHTTWSYLGDPQRLINPDETLAENFVIGDMRPGWYEIIISLQGTEYRAEVEVIGGRLSTVEIITEPVKTATPEPLPTTIPEADADPTVQSES